MLGSSRFRVAGHKARDINRAQFTEPALHAMCRALMTAITNQESWKHRGLRGQSPLSTVTLFTVGKEFQRRREGSKKRSTIAIVQARELWARGATEGRTDSEDRPIKR